MPAEPLSLALRASERELGVGRLSVPRGEVRPSSLGADAAAWLVSPTFDLWIFGAPAVLALLLIPLGVFLAPDGETPLPMWVVVVLGVDVAHVWATLFRTYLDPVERARRRVLLIAAPALAFGGAATLAHLSNAWFWTALAYLAVFHFIRQQYGFVALYHRKDPDLPPWERRLDLSAVYASTLYPVLWWHAHLPRAFDWFMPGDFIAGLVPPGVASALLFVYIALLVAFAGQQIRRLVKGRPARPGKVVVIGGTAACWGAGILVTNSDWAFTVTNVLLHGIPYFGIVWITARRSLPAVPGAPRPAGILGGASPGTPRLTEPREADPQRDGTRWRSLPARQGRTSKISPPGPEAQVRRFLLSRVSAFYGVLFLLAYLEELGWDRALWHEGGIFFGPAVALSPEGVAWATALLSVPQVTHYILDGFIWRRGADERGTG